jgi:cell division protein FtsB
MRPRVVLVAAVVVAALVVGYAFFAPSGMPTLSRLQTEEKKLSDDVAQKKAENARLVGDVQQLQGDTAASKLSLEKRARDELGYVAPGEVIVQVPDSATKHVAPPPAATPTNTTTAPAPEAR